MVAEEFLAQGTVLGVLLPQLAVGVGTLVAAWHLPTQALLLLHGLQGPHGSCGTRLQPAGIDGGQREAQEQQTELVGIAGGQSEPWLGGRRGPLEGPSASSKPRELGTALGQSLASPFFPKPRLGDQPRTPDLIS